MLGRKGFHRFVILKGLFKHFHQKPFFKVVYRLSLSLCANMKILYALFCIYHLKAPTKSKKISNSNDKMQFQKIYVMEQKIINKKNVLILILNTVNHPTYHCKLYNKPHSKSKRAKFSRWLP